jgi:hypothetical protein
MGFRRSSRGSGRMNPFVYEKEVPGGRRIDVQVEPHLQGGRVAHWHTTGPEYYKNNPGTAEAIKQRGGDPGNYGWVTDTYPSGFNTVEGMKKAIEYQLTATKDSPDKEFFDPKAPGGYGVTSAKKKKKKRQQKDWIGRECDCGNPYSNSCPVHGKRKEEPDYGPSPDN